jgi:flagellar basal body P-ring formation protein FlgA
MKRWNRIFWWFLLGCLAGGLAAAADGRAAVLEENQIKQIVSAYIQRHMPWAPDDVHITFLSGFKDIAVSAPAFSYEIHEQPNEPFIGDSSFTLKLYHNGVFIGERAIRVKMEVAFDVLVSARALAMDAVIGPDDVRVIKRWLTREPQQAVTSVEEALDKRIVCTVRPNRDIARNMLREVPLVKKGKMAKIILTNGLIHIATVGQIQEDGALGSLVKVKNVSSQRVVYAKVVGDSLVQVDF